MWPLTSYDIDDNTIVLHYVEQYYLEKPRRKKQPWAIVFVFVSGDTCRVVFDTEQAARNEFEKLRAAYRTHVDGVKTL